jgi:type II restriction enzyme
MRVEMPLAMAARYKSPSQRARVLSEAWGRQNLYCARCAWPRLQSSPPNTQVVDFVCPTCAASFQLKSQSRAFSRRICDAAYEPMRRAIEENRVPNLLALHYDRLRWTVYSLVLIPSFALTLSSLEKRKPLGSAARRKGWVGCNILLMNIPIDARITMVWRGTPVRPEKAHQDYLRLQPLEEMPHERRGWTLDVLKVVRSLGKAEFSLADVYRCSDELRRLHPQNLHVREKVRQQLQRLRDIGLVTFLGSGRYQLKP